MIPLAQNVAGEIVGQLILEGWLEPDADNENEFSESIGAYIQSAITEAVDAAVAQERERTTKIATRMKTAAAVNGHDAYAQEVLRVFADELESLASSRSESKAAEQLSAEAQVQLRAFTEACMYAEASLGAVQVKLTQTGDLKGAGLMQPALDKVRTALKCELVPSVPKPPTVLIDNPDYAAFLAKPPAEWMKEAAKACAASLNHGLLIPKVALEAAENVILHELQQHVPR